LDNPLCGKDNFQRVGFNKRVCIVRCFPPGVNKMDKRKDEIFGVRALSEFEAKREWFVGVLGGGLCYGLILWLSQG